MLDNLKSPGTSIILPVSLETKMYASEQPRDWVHGKAGSEELIHIIDVTNLWNMFKIKVLDEDINVDVERLQNIFIIISEVLILNRTLVLIGEETKGEILDIVCNELTSGLHKIGASELIDNESIVDIISILIELGVHDLLNNDVIVVGWVSSVKLLVHLKYI